MRYCLLTLLLLFLSCTDWDLPKDYPDTVTLSTDKITDSSVTLVWSKASDTHFGNYTIYKGDGALIDTTDEVLDTIIFSVDTVYTVKGLTAGTEYSFRVMVNSPEGTYTVSNVVTAKTTVDLNKVQLKLAQPDTTEISENSVQLRWGFDKWEWNDTLTTYAIYMDTTATVDSLDSLIDTVQNLTNYTVTNLEADKKYFFRVYLNHDDTSKAGSNTVEITTDDGYPDAVSIVDVDSIGGNWARIKFTRSTEADFAYYCIWHGETKAVDSLKTLDTSSSFATVIPTISDTLGTITDLAYEKEYHFSVYTVDTQGNFTPSNVVSLMTKDSLYEQFSLEKSAVTDAQIALQFDAYKGSDFVQYEVRGSNSSATITEQSPLLYSSTSVTDTMPVITGLTAGKQYFVKVFVKTTGTTKSSNTISNYPVLLNTPVVVDSVVHLSWGTLQSNPLFNAYKLYRSTTATGGELLVKKFDSMSETEYSDTLTAGTYYYRVYEVLEGGATSGEASNQVMVVVE